MTRPMLKLDLLAFQNLVTNSHLKVQAGGSRGTSRLQEKQPKTISVA